MGLPIAKPWFRRRTCADGVTLLDEPHVDPFARCNVWHVRGRARDLLVDTGLGIRSLCKAAADLFERRVTVVLTHSHFDHIGGAHEFAERLAHGQEAEELATPRGFRGLTARALGEDLVRRLRGAGYDLPETLLTALPDARFPVDDYRVQAAPLTGTVADGDVIDLGDRRLEVLHVPGHSPGSIALWEPATRILFSGDAVYDGPLLADLPGSNVADYAGSLRRLASLDVAVVHAGHDPSFGGERLREITERTLRQWEAARSR